MLYDGDDDDKVFVCVISNPSSFLNFLQVDKLLICLWPFIITTYINTIQTNLLCLLVAKLDQQSWLYVHIGKVVIFFFLKITVTLTCTRKQVLISVRYLETNCWLSQVLNGVIASFDISH